MKNELINRNSFLAYLYKSESDLIHLGDFGNFRLLTDYPNEGYSIPEVKDDLLQYYSFLTSLDIPFAKEFNFSDNDKVLLLTEDNQVAYIDLNTENSYQVIANSIEELFDIDYQINFIISQGHRFQIITKPQNIENIIPDNRFIEINEMGYYELSDYKKLLQDVFTLNRNFKDNIIVNTQELNEENNIRYQFDIKAGPHHFSFDFLSSDEPNTINSDDGFMNSIFIGKLNDIFKQIKDDYFFFLLENQKSVDRYRQYIAYLNQIEYQKLMKHNFRVTK